LGIQKKPLPTSSPPQSPKPAVPELKWNVIPPRHTMSDLILAPSTEEQLLDVISYFENRELLFSEWNLAERFSDQDGLAVNLYGPPGTSKTVAAHAIASALHLPMICVDYAEIESKYVGETAKNLSALFRTASEQNALIFFDEADALLSKRVTNMTSATDVSVNQTRSVLLTLLNQYRGVILFATNFIQNFDAAFLRRIRYHVYFPLPDARLRERLWRMYIPNKMPCRADFHELAEKFEGISGSDIANAVLTAAIRTARSGESFVSQERLEEAIRSTVTVKRENLGEDISVKRRLLSPEEADLLIQKEKLSL